MLFAPPALADPTATGPTGTQAFGDAQINTATAPASRSYVVTNTGTDPVWVISSTLGGAQTDQFSLAGTCADRGAGNPLAAGQTCTVIVAFKPTSTGSKSTTLTTVTNGPTFVTGAITGFGRHLSAQPVDFAGQRVGTSVKRVVRITNDGAEPYPLGAVTLSSQWVKGTDGCGSKTLEAGASCDVEVSFAPTTAGVKSGFVMIAGHKPHLVALAGEGTEPIAAISPASADVAGGETFTVRNTGNEALVLGAAKFSAAGFVASADGCSGQTVAPGGSCALTVALTAGDPGWRTARLELPVPGLAPVLARVSGRVGIGGLDADPFGPFVLAQQPVARLVGDGGDNLGAALSGGCDVNGDGFDDVITGASLWSVSPAESSWEGATYVTFGGPRFGSSDLAATVAGRTIRIEGEKVRAQTGTSAACAGDVNGDGIEDLAIGAWAYEYDGRPAGTGAPRGAAYVVFGARDLASAGPLDLGLLGARGFRIVAPNAFEYDHLGYVVTGVGDLDGDGRGEVALMANTADSSDTTPARTSNGRIYVVRGQAGTGTVDASASSLLTLIGVTPGQLSAVAPVGDLNADGVGDLVVGAYTGVFSGRSTASGRAFAISGAKRGVVDLAVEENALFSVGGAFAGHRLGIGVAAAGDVNDDGRADVLLGADSTAAANSDAAYVIFGGATGTLDTADLGTRGFRILGAPGSSAGYSIAPAGDVDHDGRDDVLVGAYGAGTAGSAYLVPGVADVSTLKTNNAAGVSAIVPANLNDATRYVALADLAPLAGVSGGERFGRQVANVGDIDGNGAADFAFGADMAYRQNRTRAGEVTVALVPGAAPPAPTPTATPTATPTVEPTVTATPIPAVPTPTPTPVAPAPKRASVSLAARSLTPDARGRVALSLRCAATGGACTGRATVKLAGVSRSVRFTAQPGKTMRVTVALTAAQRRSLGRHKRVSGKATLAVTNPDGTTTTRTVTITVRGRAR
ncbi:choice-of-anchor D domain-containing protein [Solirubrobacter phytolaccae]|uniref:Choice-of-anchor D domain-containing protein n=1 Tax=Solirubrobacter phytolaccae TaxID=1404360 RepID=A0A9X3N6M1_9ACTN|nr:choice-of-anchor D domain-containing protein [Solirubrobacter phytolaccae]MDA0180718.1 choice-of-anchor D domain-containing protein [Solirubrobacter phytolaccae]